jgi:histidinol-phosphate phosphatase family protein
MAGLVVLDRDGTVIEERPYLHDPKQVRLLPNAAAGLRALRESGLKLALVTNQSGVGRGFFGLDAVARVNNRVMALLAREGVTIDEVFVCPHAPEAGCACRKPGTRLLEAAAQRLGTDSSKTFVIGDKACDVEMGRRAGATALLVRTGWGRDTEGRAEARPHYVAADLLEAARLVLAHGSPRGDNGSASAAVATRS